MANEFGHALVPIYITVKAASAGTALYSVTRLVYAFTVQKSTVATAVTLGTSTGGVKLTATSPKVDFPALMLGRNEPMQYDLSQFKAVAAAASSVAITVVAIVKKAQAGSPPS
jgi:hypothetical protein